jgi:hypothetical protein
MGITHNRATTNPFVKAIPHRELLGLGDEQGDELVIYTLLDVDTRTGSTVLASIVQDPKGGPGCSYGCITVSSRTGA